MNEAIHAWHHSTGCFDLSHGDARCNGRCVRSNGSELSGRDPRRIQPWRRCGHRGECLGPTTAGGFLEGRPGRKQVSSRHLPGNKALIDSAPDGHTLMLATNALVANVSLFQPAVYDMSRITPIAMVGRVERQALSRLSADTNHCRVWICWIRRVGVAWAGGARRTPRAASSSPNGRWRGAAQGDCVVCRAFAA